jgi:hypothetical protein
MLLRQLSERSHATPTEWTLGTEACVRALASGGDTAETCYRESIDRLSRTRMRAYLARVHLLYGEWLRREKRRTKARQQLRRAYEMLTAMSIEAFAERAQGLQQARHHLAQATPRTAACRHTARAADLGHWRRPQYAATGGRSGCGQGLRCR